MLVFEEGPDSQTLGTKKEQLLSRASCETSRGSRSFKTKSEVSSKDGENGRY